MIRMIEGLPDNVVAVSGVGEVSSADYTSTLDPAIDAALEKYDKIRLLYVLGEEFTGYGDGAAWEDVKLGVTTFNSYERMAIVTDSESVRRTIKAFGWLIPGDVQVFHLDGIVAATVWITD